METMDHIPSPLPVEQALGQKFLLSFHGLEALPEHDETADAIQLKNEPGRHVCALRIF